MNLTLVEGPGIEPITLDEAKLHLRVDGDDEDELIEGLITSARVWAEEYTARAFILQSWDLKNDYGFPACFERIPRPPLSSVTSITYIDTDGTSQTLATSEYTVDAPAGPHAGNGRVVPAYDVSWPTTRSVINAVTLRYEAGYGDTEEDVPHLVRQALKIAVGHLYFNRDAGAEMPKLVRDILYPFRMELI